MHVTRLDVRALRQLADVRLTPQRGLNLITGDNGAGKTSVLEALHLMAYGRSFRGRVREGLIASDAAALEVYVEWIEEPADAPPKTQVENDPSPGRMRERRAGLRHSGQRWEGRLDGASVAQLGELCAALAVVSFEPGSHSLVQGGGEPRRRYVDWGLFHVEPGFLSLWRRYARALKQRNALLKARARPNELDAWDRELVEAGEPLSRRRQGYLDQLQPQLQREIAELAPALGDTTFIFHPGWRRELSLADALFLARERDLQAGFTSVGPHRADWRLLHAAHPNQEALSRGQAKLVALSSVLAQAAHYRGERGEWPVIALDDLASELDRTHQHRVLARLLASGAQIFITGTEPPAVLAGLTAEVARFHVEQGRLERLQP